jgi:predicted outer membrane repeat protein
MRAPLLLAFGCVLACARPADAATGGPDSFGYTWDDNPLNPPLFQSSAFQWIDITGTGQLVINSGNNVSSIHPVQGIGAPVTLGRPFTIYGATYTQLVPAVDGYLSTNLTDAGLDNTNDCPLPKAPSDGGGARIYGYHDDLTLGAGSGVYYQYFPVIPLGLNRTGASVFTWENVALSGSPANTFDFQILLFDDGDIIFQYRAGALSLGGSATIGIQNAAANIALSWSCNTGGTIAGNRILHFRPPTIVVNTTQDQNDTPRGTQVSLREAIRDIPIGGKVVLPDSDNFALRLPSSLAINKTLAISSEDTLSPLIDGVSFAIGSGARVVFNNLHLRNQPGNGFSVSGGANVKMTWCRVDGSRSRTVLVSGGGHADLQRTAILHGAAGSGNMIEVNGGTVSLSESLLAFGRGHGIAFDNTAPTATPQVSISRSSIIHQEGEGLRGTGSRVNVFASTISANEGGFGINLASSSILALDRSAISANFAGLALDGSCSATVNRTIIAGNTHPYTKTTVNLSTSTASVVSGGYNLLGSSHPAFAAAGDVVAADPKLAPVAPKNLRIGTRSILEFIYAHSLLDGSPAIDGGGLTSVPASENLDVRGQPRIQDGAAPGTAIMDIGPLEMGPQVRVTTTIDENNGVGAGAGVSLREALLAHDNGHVVFAAGLNGQTFLNSSSTFACGQDEIVDASSLSSGVTLDGQDAMTGDMLAGGEWIRVSVRRANMLVSRNSFSLVLADATFSDNSNDVVTPNTNERYSGALYTSGYTFITGCRFINNRADNISGFFPGGAIACREFTWQGGLVTPPSLYVIGTRFEENYSIGSGGAVYASSNVAVVLIDRCNFAGNNNEASGGAVALLASDIYPTLALHRIRRSSFASNYCVGGNGGAISLGSSVYHQPEIRHTTIHGNFANEDSPSNGFGGALDFHGGGILKMDHVTLAANGATSGGAVRTNGIVQITNSALAGNFLFGGLGGSGPDFSVVSGGSVASGGYNVSDIVGSWFTHVQDLPAQPLRLEPPHDHGDGTVCLHPLAGSPLIDAGSTSTSSTDQRGFPGLTGARTDIGAVEAAPMLLVTTAIDQNDSPAGAQLSLREAIRDALPGQRIQFNLAAMGGNVINLATGTNSQLTVDKSLRIEAGNTPNGITINGPSAARVMNISQADARVFIDGVSMRDGNASLSGGAVRQNGALLRLSRSALYQNSASSGGAIIALNGETWLENVTIAENTTSSVGTGGAILAQNSAIVYLDHCTVAENTCTNGGGIDLDHTATVSFRRSAFSENLVTSILQSRNFIAEAGANILSRGNNRMDSPLGAWATPTDTSGFCDLESLSDFGGLARVCRPSALSPLRDAVLVPGPVPPTDARGFLRVHGPGLDIGAAELVASDLGVGPDTDNDGMPDSWETLYTFLINNPADAHLDADGDGQTNLDEYRAGTHPRDPNSVFRILSIDVAPDRSRLDFTWSSVPGRTYTVWHSTNLSIWTPIDSGTAGTSQTIMAGAITNPALLPAGKVFLQVRVSFP